MKITRKQLSQIISEVISEQAAPFSGDWYAANWPKLEAALEAEITGPYNIAGEIPEEELEDVWKKAFGNKFDAELGEVEDTLDDRILSTKFGKQERSYTLDQLRDIVKDLDAMRTSSIPVGEEEGGDGQSQDRSEMGHRAKDVPVGATEQPIPTSGKGRKDALRRAEIIKSLRENKMKITRKQLRQIIKEELNKAAPFGSGMKQAKLDKDQKDVVGHT